ncbi:SAF domain-containing protein [Bifidobacterium sp. ESL0745]|uniref:flagella basal body P-ring formation protein FlgA n=1 Tax=Bifidobacterium sp. ESL0745 TaxID=2983226 RepID=UPI0023F86EEB|nr:SAF domain-containing protein [Bifidobacterium sp. ESL0745]MDF7665509.1 flagella basal body P-ring formation protein FlgA [Bifidobacterium sp. ESL0745]
MNLFQSRSKQRLNVKKPTLKQRRTLRQTRTILAALCVGLAVFFALQSISSSVATKSAVTATHAIKRGQTIHADDLRTVHIADSPALADVFAAENDVTGQIAQVDIESGSVVCRPMARASPVIKPGLTVIDVKVTGSGTALIPGDRVSLVGSAGCDTLANMPAQKDSAAQQSDVAAMDFFTASNVGKDSAGPRRQSETDNSKVGLHTKNVFATNQSNGETCMLAQQATVTGSAHRDDSGITTTQLAMPPQDAARIMAVQERMPIMAAKR